MLSTYGKSSSVEVLMEVYGSVISSTLESEIVWFRDTEWNKSSVVWNLCKEEVIQFINIICVVINL